MIFKAVRERPPYPDHGVTTQRDWAVIAPRQIRLADLTTTRATLDLRSLLDDDSTFYGDLFAHVVSFKGDLYLETGLHRALRAALQGRTAIHARILEVTEEGVPRLAGRSEGAFSLDEAFRGGGSSPQVVEYGQSVTFGSWVCSSEETGMTCRNTETGHGVFLSSGRYETF